MCALYSFPLRRIRRLPQLNSELYGLHLHLLHLSGTTDEYGQLWVGDTGINLSDVKFIDCVSNTFTRPTNPYGIVNLEGIEGDSLKFRLRFHLF